MAQGAENQTHGGLSDMDGRKVILNPGLDRIVLEGSEAGYADGVLWLYIKGQTLAQTFALLSNPTNTAVIEFHYGDMVDRYENFTHLIVLQEGENQVSAALERS